MTIFEKIFGTYSEREIKKIQPLVNKVLALENEYSQLTSKQLQNKTEEFRNRLKTESLDDILPEAFATVREASWRVLGLKPYEVQVLGGIVLHQGRIAEMKTGEGKTLVATMPAYLNALKNNVLVVTVNEYLAKRDSEQMGKVFSFLGLSVGFIHNDLSTQERKVEYSKDILYTTNNEIGFDYLRDNMATDEAHQVQKDFNFVIIDEVDSILIDEARTPLIISGQTEGSVEGYIKANNFVKKLRGVLKDNDEDKMSKLEMKLMEGYDNGKYKNYDYIIDQKTRTVVLTEKGVYKAEKAYDVENLMDIENVEINHYITQALKAHSLFKKDVDYLIKDDKVIIIDEHTGRIMEGRRYSEGIHQAIEVKENVEIQDESKTLATISFQNLFRKFKKLSGMTGTAMTENTEFNEIYNIDVIEIPTNKPLIREDKVDKVYPTKEGKLKGIIETIKNCNEKGQPILVGTASVEASEELSDLLTKEGIKHNVLNAKNHEEEAKIIAKAGHYGKVTVATNMAGRGTDIILGGNVDYKVKEELSKLGYPKELVEMSNTHTDTNDDEVIAIRKKYKKLEETISEEVQNWVDKVKEVGGLYVLGTERHSSRRIDNQLRGRAGRQGDPGVSEFLISLEDELMVIFGANKFSDMFEKMNLPTDMPVNMKLISNAIETAQKKVEGLHYQARRTLIQYDEVMNIQREIIYKERNNFLKSDNIIDPLKEMTNSYIEDIVNNVIHGPITLETQEILNDIFKEISGFNYKLNYTEDELAGMQPKYIIYNISNYIFDKLDILIKSEGKENINQNAKMGLLFFIDKAWQDHLVAMEDLKEGVGLRAVGQQDPVLAYKNEGYYMFHEMLHEVKGEIVSYILTSYENTINIQEDK